AGAMLHRPGTLADGTVAQCGLTGRLRVSVSGPMNPHYLETAARLAGRLCRDAIWSGGLCNWTADRPSGNSAAHAAPTPQLDAGTSGVALALAAVASATGDGILRAAAEGAIRCALARMPLAGCGFYTGGLGVLFAAAEILGDVDQAAVLRQAE